MTAPTEVAAPAARMTLADRLQRLAERVRTEADGGGIATEFAAGVLLQLEPALAAARMQAAQADELEILRAQAADREHARAVLHERLPRDLDLLAATARGQSAEWAIRRMRDALAMAARTTTKESTDAAS